MPHEIVGNFDGSSVRVGIVASRFNGVVTDRLVAAALDCFRRHGVADDRIVLVRVPGAFEIPAAAWQLFAAATVDGVVAVGCLIRGETAHYDYLCDAVVGGLAAIGRDTGRCVTCGVLTVDTLEQALQRAGGKHGDKGFEAAQALLECLSVEGRLRR